MKKLFVCAMALAAFVSCSKDDVAQGPELDSKNKSIEIKIANASTGTRAEGGITAAGEEEACAEATDLFVIFATSDGTIVDKLKLTEQATTDPHPDNYEGKDVAENTPGYTEETDTYIWHNVDWSVTRVAVVRTSKNVAAPGYVDVSGYKNLNQYIALAQNEDANIARSVDDIVLYGEGTLKDTGDTHRINDIVYHVWSAWYTDAEGTEVEGIRVAPKFARFEINRLECSDLGDANNDGDPSTYGFDRLIVNSLTWNDSYTAKNFTGTLAAGENTNFMVAEGGVWSWNVLPTTFSGLVVDMDAESDEYEITLEEVPLVVTGLSSTQEKANAKEADANAFVAENIYKLDLTFTEANIIDPEGLCVKVTVEIVPWTVKTVYPVFGKPATTNAQ